MRQDVRDDLQERRDRTSRCCVKAAVAQTLQRVVAAQRRRRPFHLDVDVLTWRGESWRLCWRWCWFVARRDCCWCWHWCWHWRRTHSAVAAAWSNRCWWCLRLCHWRCTSRCCCRLDAEDRRAAHDPELCAHVRLSVSLLSHVADALLRSSVCTFERRGRKRISADLVLEEAQRELRIQTHM